MRKKYNHFDLHFTFERKHAGIRFLHAEYVHPLKQDLVQEFQRDFKEDGSVHRAL